MDYDKFGRKVSAVTGKRLPTWNYLDYRQLKLIAELKVVEQQMLEHNKDEYRLMLTLKIKGESK